VHSINLLPNKSSFHSSGNFLCFILSSYLFISFVDVFLFPILSPSLTASSSTFHFVKFNGEASE
jgi:hypothetical protein